MAVDANQLWYELYDELRQIAQSNLLRERPGHTLQPSALVHEVYLKLDRQGKVWSSKRAFIKAAAEAMRYILIDAARRKTSAKRGKGLERIELNPNDLAASLIHDDDADYEQLAELDQALEGLAADNPRAAQVVQLRSLARLSNKQIADRMEISERTCIRLWQYARAWLYRELKMPESD